MKYMCRHSLSGIRGVSIKIIRQGKLQIIKGRHSLSGIRGVSIHYGSLRHFLESFKSRHSLSGIRGVSINFQGASIAPWKSCRHSLSGIRGVSIFYFVKKL